MCGGQSRLLIGSVNKGLCVCSQKTTAFWSNDTHFNVQRQRAKRSRAGHPSKNSLRRIPCLSLEDLVIRRPNGRSNWFRGDHWLWGPDDVQGWVAGRLMACDGGPLPATENLHPRSNQAEYSSHQRERGRGTNGLSFPRAFERGPKKGPVARPLAQVAAAPTLFVVEASRQEPSGAALGSAAPVRLHTESGSRGGGSGECGRDTVTSCALLC